ncbi:MAG: MFS transporter [Elusimicrobia bacterium]|nr:MFS transporter [Elusimicrobiota bacterium]
MDAPKHSSAYRIRRALNWVPLGFAYAFLYMGRYNLTVSKSVLGDALMTKAQFGEIFAVGAWVYALSFLVTGPLTDKLGGRLAMLIGTAGAMLANFLMGLTLYGIANWGWNVSIFAAFMGLYALNMHFQSYGAISIVTVKAPWFHVRERGTFSTIFGSMIAFGLYFAFDWGFAVAEASRAVAGQSPSFIARVFAAVFGLGGTGVDQNWWIFFVPALILAVFWTIMFLFLRNTPGEAGYKDFDTGEESVSATGERLPMREVFLKIITHPVLLVVCGIEFCSGVLRNGVMHWYPLFARETGIKFWVTQNWGLMLLLAGLTGSFLTGWCSDRFFHSRRAPMAAILYGLMGASAGVMALSLGANFWYAGAATMLISMSVTGVHGILSGTSTTDFGGTRNAGAATGIVDGMVYLGTGMQSIVIGHITPVGELAKDPANWQLWPVFLAPFSVIGFILSLRIWNALPKKAARPAAVAAEPVLQPET